MNESLFLATPMAAISNTYSWTAGGFDPQNAGEIHLRMYLREGYLEYAILNSKMRIAAIRELKSTADLDDADLLASFLLNEKELKLPFKSVRFISARGLFTLVPEKIFAGTEEGDFSSLLGIHEGSGLHPQRIDVDFPKGQLLFGVNAGVRDRLISLFPNCMIVPMAKACLALTKKLCEVRNDGIYLHIAAKRIWITAIKSGVLRLCNSYEYHDPADIVYYLLLAGKVSELGTNPANVWAAGDAETENATMKQLNKLVPKLSQPVELLSEYFEGAEKPNVLRYAILAF